MVYIQLACSDISIMRERLSYSKRISQRGERRDHKTCCWYRLRLLLISAVTSNTHDNNSRTSLSLLPARVLPVISLLPARVHIHYTIIDRRRGCVYHRVGDFLILVSYYSRSCHLSCRVLYMYIHHIWMLRKKIMRRGEKERE